jgi:hypothetical protein
MRLMLGEDHASVEMARDAGGRVDRGESVGPVAVRETPGFVIRAGRLRRVADRAADVSACRDAEALDVQQSRVHGGGA